MINKLEIECYDVVIVSHTCMYGQHPCFMCIILYKSHVYLDIMSLVVYTFECEALLRILHWLQRIGIQKLSAIYGYRVISERDFMDRLERFEICAAPTDGMKIQ